MDNEGQEMIINKKMISLGILFLCLILSSGCETTKGAVVGVGATVAGTTSGIAKDSKNLWQSILKADNWLRENLW